METQLQKPPVEVHKQKKKSLAEWAFDNIDKLNKETPRRRTVYNDTRRPIAPNAGYKWRGSIILGNKGTKIYK